MNYASCADDYIKAGLSPIPQRPGTKSIEIKWAHHQKQQMESEDIETWKKRYPQAGVALLQGPIHNLLVIDVDGKEAWNALEAYLGYFPEAPRVISGSGDPFRVHLYFRHPTGVATKAKMTPLHGSLEFRGEGGVIIAPPSIHPSGRRYKWAPGRSLSDIEIPELPGPLKELLEECTPKQQRPSMEPIALPTGASRLSRRTREFLSGVLANGPNWNCRLFAAACELNAFGFDIETSTKLLIAAAGPYDSTEEQNALRAIESAYARKRLPPRRRTGS